MNAAVAVKSHAMNILALTGRSGSQWGRCPTSASLRPRVNSRIACSELHIKVIHVLIELVERQLFPENYASAPQ